MICQIGLPSNYRLHPSYCVYYHEFCFPRDAAIIIKATVDIVFIFVVVLQKKYVNLQREIMVQFKIYHFIIDIAVFCYGSSFVPNPSLDNGSMTALPRKFAL